MVSSSTWASTHAPARHGPAIAAAKVALLAIYARFQGPDRPLSWLCGHSSRRGEHGWRRAPSPQHGQLPWLLLPQPGLMTASRRHERQKLPSSPPPCPTHRAAIVWPPLSLDVGDGRPVTQPQIKRGHGPHNRQPTKPTRDADALAAPNGHDHSGSHTRLWPTHPTPTYLERGEAPVAMPPSRPSPHTAGTGYAVSTSTGTIRCFVACS